MVMIPISSAIRTGGGKGSAAARSLVRKRPSGKRPTTCLFSTLHPSNTTRTTITTTTRTTATTTTTTTTAMNPFPCASDQCFLLQKQGQRQKQQRRSFASETGLGRFPYRSRGLRSSLSSRCNHGICYNISNNNSNNNSIISSSHPRFDHRHRYRQQRYRQQRSFGVTRASWMASRNSQPSGAKNKKSTRKNAKNQIQKQIQKQKQPPEQYNHYLGPLGRTALTQPRLQKQLLSLLLAEAESSSSSSSPPLPPPSYGSGLQNFHKLLPHVGVVLGDKDNDNDSDKDSDSDKGSSSPKYLWNLACDRFGCELPMYRHQTLIPGGGDENENENENESSCHYEILPPNPSNPNAPVFVATAVTIVEEPQTQTQTQLGEDDSQGCCYKHSEHSEYYRRLKEHDHVGSHPDFSWVELVSVGIAGSKQAAETLAALDQMVLWEEATGIDLSLPLCDWPQTGEWEGLLGFDGNHQTNINSHSHNHNHNHNHNNTGKADAFRERYETSRRLLELTRCSKIRFDHEKVQGPREDSSCSSSSSSNNSNSVRRRGRRRRTAASATTEWHWTAEAETWFRGKYYFSESTTSTSTSTSTTTKRSRAKAEAERHALVALLEQNANTPLGRTADAYRTAMDRSPSGQVASLVVPKLADPVLKRLDRSMGYTGEGEGAGEGEGEDEDDNTLSSPNTSQPAKEHAARKRRHRWFIEQYEAEELARRRQQYQTGNHSNDNDNGNGNGNDSTEHPCSAFPSTGPSEDLWDAERAKLEYHATHNAEAFDRLQTLRRDLPIRAIREDFLKALQSHQVVVISGGTGSGKSTQCPQYILEDALASGKGAATRVVVTQPRRIAAVSLGERVASERFDDDSVGYAVRFRSRPPRPNGGSIEFVTTGILLRRLLSDSSEKMKNDTSNTAILDGVTHVVIDEVHERDSNTDFLLILFRDLLRKRPDLKLVLMSATLDAESFGDYFAPVATASEKVPVMSVPAQPLHPVEKWYLEDVVAANNSDDAGGLPFSPRLKTLATSLLRHNQELLHRELEELTMYRENVDRDTSVDNGNVKTKQVNNRIAVIQNALSHTISNRFSGSPSSLEEVESSYDAKKFDFRSTITGLVSEVALHRCRVEIDSKRTGSILCFLPGMDEIKQCIVEIEEHCPTPELRNKITILPLHSSIPQDDQQRVFEPAGPGTVKLILATNIAESSVTIDDVLTVIDTGLVREMVFDASSAMSTMETNPTSKASATQRLGRAGRVAPGTCYRLYSKGDFEVMDDRPTPELQRTALESACLQTCSMMEHSSDFFRVQDFLARAMDPPEEESVGFAIDRLTKIGAITTLACGEDGIEKEHVTPLGRCLARLPLDPATGKMLVMAVVMKCLGPLLTAASCFSSKNAFYEPPKEREKTKEIRKAFSSESDILASVRAYDEFWDKIQTEGWKTAREWAYQKNVSISAMTSIKAVRTQLLNELRKAGLVPREDIIGNSRRRSRAVGKGELYPAATVNINADCEMLTRAIWCTAFPENLASRRRIGRFGTVRTSREDDAGLHPSSVLFHRKPPPSDEVLPDWYLYREKVRTSDLFLRGCSTLSPEQILLFGGYDLKRHGEDSGGNHFDYTSDDDDHQIRCVLDGWILVEGKNSKETIDSLLRARENIEMIFERSIMYPKHLKKRRGKTMLVDSSVDDTGSNGDHIWAYQNDEFNDDSVIAGVRELFDSLTLDQNSRIYEKELEIPSDDFHDYFLEQG